MNPMNPFPERLYKVMKFGSYWKTLVSETKIWEKMLITAARPLFLFRWDALVYVP